MTRWTVVLLLLGMTGCIAEDDEPAAEPEADAAVAVDAAEAPDPDAGPPPDAAADAAPEPDAAPPAPCGNEDELAPNQTREDAAPVAAGFTRDDLFMCAESEDWFAVPLAADQRITVRLLADPPERDLDLAVLDPDGALLIDSAGETGRETVELVAPADGTYFVQVIGYRDQAAFYSLRLDAGCAVDGECGDAQVCDRARGTCADFDRGDCGADAYEPNDRDDQAATTLEGGVYEGVLCAADRDWFTLAVPQGGGYDLLAAFPDGFDVDLLVIDADGRVVAEADSGNANPERLRVDHLPAGDYRLGLLAFAAEGAEQRDFDYRLEVAGRSSDGCSIDRDCAADGFPRCVEGVCEPIDSAGQVPLGGQCGRDADCDPEAQFCYLGGAGGHDNVCTIACDDFGQCGALGRGAECTPVSRNQGVCLPGCESDDDCSLFRTCQAGMCEIRGECASDRDCAAGDTCEATRFGRFCRSGAAGPAACGDDGVANDSQAEAQPVAIDGDPVMGLICDEDRDWFQVTVPAEAAAWQLSVSVAFRAGVDIDLYLYDSEGAPVGESTSPDQVEEVVELRYAAPGDYFALVDQFSTDGLADTEFTLDADLIDNEDRCTVEGNECGNTEPLRAQCNAETGACESVRGAGMLPPGAVCDSNDDCGDDSEVCWTFEGGAQGFNICTYQCQTDDDCAPIEGAVCTQFQGGRFAVCLPPR